MEKKQIVLYLGYSALILLALYFAVGILKIGGDGLASLGYSQDSFKEGFSEGMSNEERQEQKMERLSKSLDKSIKQYDEMSDQIDKKNDDINQVMGLSQFSQIIEIVKSGNETDIKQKLVDAVSRGTSLDSISASIIKDAQFIQALDTYGSGSVGGGASAAASKASGGYF